MGRLWASFDKRAMPVAIALVVEGSGYETAGKLTGIVGETTRQR